MEERMRFVARLLEGEEMSHLCREFGISRKTGYKIYDRYKEAGLEAFTDRTRRPFRYGNQLPFQVETAIVALKKEKPHWGARKLRELLLRKFPSEVRVPAVSTIHAVLAAMSSSSLAKGDATGLKARRSRWERIPTTSGASTSKASSSWVMVATATRSPSPTRLQDISSFARLWSP